MVAAGAAHPSRATAAPSADVVVVWAPGAKLAPIEHLNGDWRDLYEQLNA